MSHRLIKPLLVFAVILIVGVVAFNQYRQKQVDKAKEFDNILRAQYKNHLETKAEAVEDLIVTIANSSETPLSESGDGQYDKSAAPLIIVQDERTQEIKSIYEVSYFDQGNKDYSEGNIIIPEKISFQNIDKDPEKELVTVWNISWGGSGGLKGIIILDKVGDNLVPIPGIPSKPDNSSHFYLTEKKTGTKVEFGATGLSDYVQIADINDDGFSELLLGSFIWDLDKGESHFADHNWNLEVYDLGDKERVIPNWWNGGKVYTTPDKIGFDEHAADLLYEDFRLRMVNRVLFLCDQNRTIESTFENNNVHLLIDNYKKVDLTHAESASGARFANKDESFVFWNKGNEAFVQENGKMTHINCVIKK